jgi:hypothetical protein
VGNEVKPDIIKSAAVANSYELIYDLRVLTILTNSSILPVLSYIFAPYNIEFKSLTVNVGSFTDTV